MAKIPQSELDQLKKEIDLVMLIQQKGIAVTKQGSDYKCICPFHDDKNPSLIITPSKGLWHCFPCNIGGTVIDWVIKTEKVSFRHAVEILQEKGGVITPTIKKTRSPQTGLKEPITIDQQDQEIIQNTIDYYHESFLKHEKAKDYLKSRNIYTDEIIEKFKIGFADRTLGLRIPYKQVSTGKKLRDKLQNIGILKHTGHEHFRGSITIPISNTKGEIKEIYGRKIANRLREGTPKHTYLKGKHGGIFNPDCLSDESKTIYLCESIIDSLSLYRYDFKNTTSSFGTNGLTEEMTSLFLDHHIAKIYFFYDSDNAGETAYLKQAKTLSKEGMQCFRVRLPKDKDLNEMITLWNDPKEQINILINKAEWVRFSNNSTPTRAPFYSLAANSSYATDEENSLIITQNNIKDNLHNLSSDESEVIAAKEKSINTFSHDEESKQDSSLVAKQSLVENNCQDKLDIPTIIKDEEIFISLGDRSYRIQGFFQNTKSSFKVIVKASRGYLFHIDTFDMNHAKAKSSFVLACSKELEINETIIDRDIKRIFSKLDELKLEKLEKLDESQKKKDKTINLSEKEKQETLKYLKDKNLINNILRDFNKCGVIGEDNNKLVAYLASTSRMMDKPLAVIIQSSSSAGKTSLMEAVLDFMPPEEQLKYSAITGQSLFYMGETDIKHKILAIVEEEGAEKASYSLKLLQSEGKLSIASTGKDSQGRMNTETYEVEGPVMIFLTTTAMDIDEELLNRCLVLTVNETKKQTQRIHQLQRNSQSIEGLLKDKTKLSILARQRNAQRLLKPVIVANPYAKYLSFLSDKTRMRRDHLKYLTLIRSIAFLHQYQREIKTIDHEGQKVSYIEVTIDDIELANKLCHEVLGRSLSELSPQTKSLLNLIHEMVQKTISKEGIRQEDFNFTRKTIREYTGLSDNQLKVHMRRLEDLEYLRVFRIKAGSAYVYELLYKGEAETMNNFVMGLIDIESLKRKSNEYDTKWLDENSRQLDLANKKLYSSCPQVGGELVGCLSTSIPDLQALLDGIPEDLLKTHVYIEKFNPSDHNYMYHTNNNLFSLAAKKLESKSNIQVSVV